MKIAHIISSLGKSCGGPSRSVYSTVRALRDSGVDVDILTYQDTINNNPNVSEEDFVRSVIYKKNMPFAYNADYKKLFTKDVYELYHTHAFFQYPSYIAVKYARKYNRPYIITPRGSLYPQALEISKFKKKLFLKFFLLEDLNQAAVIQATSKEEMLHIRNMGVKTPIAIIQNPIDIAISDSTIAPSPTKLRIGFIGRIHPIKNIENLLYVWDKLKLDSIEAELVVIGDSHSSCADYKEFLRKEQDRLGIKNIVWAGFLEGEEKEKMLSTFSYLVLPSKSENFGMVVPEALIKGIPVIASKGTPWEELNTHNCGWWVDNDMETLAETIKKAIDTPESVRREMGKRGQELIKNSYSAEVVADKLTKLYNWILKKEEKPEFVYEQ